MWTCCEKSNKDTCPSRGYLFVRSVFMNWMQHWCFLVYSFVHLWNQFSVICEGPFQESFCFHWTTPFSFCRYYAVSVWYLYSTFKNMYLSIFALVIKYHYQKQCTENLTLVYRGWILIMIGKKGQPMQETCLLYFHFTHEATITGHKPTKSTHNDILPPRWFFWRFYNLHTQCHQLVTKCSKTWASEGQVSFKPLLSKRNNSTFLWLFPLFWAFSILIWFRLQIAFFF